MSQSLDRLKLQFADRFEPMGDGYIFHANLRAAGYRVSASDRDRLVAQFNRRLTRLIWGFAAITILFFAAICWIFVQQSGEVPAIVPWIIAPAATCGYLAPFFWMWNAPQRELRQSMPVVQGRSKDEAKRIALTRLSWTQLGAGVVMTLALLWRVSTEWNLLIGWNRLWLVLAAAMLLIVAVQAIRKLRISRDQRTSD